jgi:hypothetical protein
MTQKHIDEFINKIKIKYPDLKIGYSYDEDENYYHIWHTNSKLQFEDNIFLSYVGGLIRECFYSNDIFNFSFGYDYIEDEKSNIKNKTTFRIFQPYYFYCHEGFRDYQGMYIFHLVTNYCQFRWFTDCGEWFLYIHIGKRWWRFSGAGYMKGVSE